MSKSKEYITTLISPGKIVENLHFGPFCHNWWLARPINKNPTHTPLLPIRLGMKTHTVLKKCDFIITVVKDTQHPNSPGFLCFSEEYRSGVCSSPTEAINTCYEKVFRSNAKFPGPQVM
ncbi:10592_t:CDS:1, partial [Rhizophagus irregularis]